MIGGIDGAPLRYRGFLLAEALAGLGIHVDVTMYRDLRVPEQAAVADAVICYRVPATTQILALINSVRAPGGSAEPVRRRRPRRRSGLGGRTGPDSRSRTRLDLELYWQRVRRCRTVLEACDGYIGSTRYLSERVGELTGLPTFHFANGVGRQLARVSDAQLRRRRSPGPVRVGYFSGTNTHNEDWAHIEPAIVRLLEQRPEVQLWIGGLLETSEALAPYAGRIKRLPLSRWFDLPPAVLRDVDVNLAPLEPGRTFHEAKSYQASQGRHGRNADDSLPSEPFRGSIVDGVTGVLADTADEWLGALIRLVDDGGLRNRIGMAAREQLLTSLSPARQGYRYREILLRAGALIAGQGHRQIFADWQPVALDEPYLPAQTEFYGHLEILPGGRVRPAGQRGALDLIAFYASTAREMLARDGVIATARRAVSVSTRLRRQGLARLRR